MMSSSAALQAEVALEQIRDICTSPVGSALQKMRSLSTLCALYADVLYNEALCLPFTGDDDSAPPHVLPPLAPGDEDSAPAHVLPPLTPSTGDDNSPQVLPSFTPSTGDDSAPAHVLPSSSSGSGSGTIKLWPTHESWPSNSDWVLHSGQALSSGSGSITMGTESAPAAPALTADIVIGNQIAPKARPRTISRRMPIASPAGIADDEDDLEENFRKKKRILAALLKDSLMNAPPPAPPAI
jgi:hypothetical protein